MDVIRVSNLWKTYQGRGMFTKSPDTTALKGVDFSIREGEIFGLLGPNGAGKSTLIHILIGLISYDKGKVEIFGKNLRTHNEWIRNQMNVATAYAQLPAALTVEQNLNIFAMMYDVKDRKRKIDEVIGITDAENLRKKKVGQLSAGQKTKINLCKALINDPKLILLDEPTASLDPDVSAHIRNQLKIIQKKRGMTILFTSHNMSEVAEMCDRVAFLSGGKIHSVGTPQNLTKIIQDQEVKLLLKTGSKIPKIIPQTYTLKHSEAGYLRFIIPNNEGAFLKFLDWARDAKIAFYDIEIRTPDLEDVFLHVAKKSKKL